MTPIAMMTLGLARPHPLPPHIRQRCEPAVVAGSVDEKHPNNAFKHQRRIDRMDAVLALLQREQMTHEAIAAALDCNLSTIKHDVKDLRTAGRVKAATTRAPIAWTAA